MKLKVFCFLALLISSSFSFAQTPLVQEGILDHLDKQRRGPVLSVRAFTENGAGQIVADAYIPYDELNKFPIRFEFYVNNELKKTQLRSPELTTPIALTVPSEMATIPFNYQVVATLLTPNRVYPTVIQGALFETQASGTFTCDVSVIEDAADIEEDTTTRDFSNESVTITQSANNQIAISFKATDLDDEEIELNGSLTLTGESVAGTIVSTEDSVSTSREVSGSAELIDNELQSLDVSNSAFELTCEKA